MKVEFSNNGLIDSLTGAPAPRNFFENLEREISKSQRLYQPLAIMTFKYLTTASEGDSEKELIELGRSIKKNMRKGDFYSRIAQDGFWVCIHANENESADSKKRFSKALLNVFNQEKSKATFSKSKVEISINLWSPEMSKAAWIRAIDLSYFD